MTDPHYLNPQILPSRKELKPADHHRILYGAVAILACATILGAVYWYKGVNPQNQAVEPAPITARDQNLLRLQQSSADSPPQERTEALTELSKSKVTTSEGQRTKALEALQKQP